MNGVIIGGIIILIILEVIQNRIYQNKLAQEYQRGRHDGYLAGLDKGHDVLQDIVAKGNMEVTDGEG